VTQDPKTPPGSAGDLDDEFDDTSGNSGPNNGLDAAWSWRNQGSATVSFSTNKAVLMVAPANSTATPTNSLRMIEQTVSGNFTFTAECCLVVPDTGTWELGVFAYNTSNGRVLTWGPTRGASAANTRSLCVVAWNSTTSFNAARANAEVANDFQTLQKWIWFRIENDGTNLIFQYSVTGIPGTYYTLLTESLAGFISAVDRVGLFCNPAVTSAGITLICRSFRGSS
jgi:hypothetical protein